MSISTKSANPSQYELSTDERFLLKEIQKRPEGASLPELIRVCRDNELFTLGDQVKNEKRSMDAWRKKIDRTLTDLCNVLPVLEERTDSRPKRYLLPASYHIPNALTVPTALSLLIAKKVLHQVFPSSLVNDINDYFDKADSFLAENGAKTYGRMIKRVAFYPEGYGARLSYLSDTQNSLIYQTVLEALIMERMVHYEYSERHNDKQYTVVAAPYGIVLRNGIVYLVAKPEGRTQLRHHNLMRIVGCPIILDQEAEIAKDFDLKKYLDDGAFLSDNDQAYVKEEIVLKVTTNVRYLLEERMGGRARFLGKVDEYGISQVSFEEYIHREFIWWLLSFGDQIEVVKPTKLRRIMKSTVDSMAEKYA
tara:strand:+ start:2087 stop:3178 length:1092 start_codon:yes stop_codon:yes gene_type:complete